jgi:cytoskeleton protein RodZ
MTPPMADNSQAARQPEPPVVESPPQAAAVPAAEAALAPDLPSDNPSSADATGQDEPYGIPAAPDNNTSATDFLVNHEPQVYGDENVGARIVLKANQDAWVQVRDRQGTLLLTRVLRVGDSYMVPNQEDLTLLTGNAGGLEVSVDGSALAPLGPVGAVRRNIPLDPEALKSGAGRQP